MPTIYAALPISVIFIVWVWSKKFSNTARGGKPLPPGPKPYPLLGNLFQFPVKEPAKVFLEWKKLYGDLIYMHDINGPSLVLNSHKAVTDLLDKRSAIYSDRPFAIMFHELADLGWMFSAMPYSDRWRQRRKLFHYFFNEHATQNYREIQEQSAHTFLHRLLQDPERFLQHIRTNFANTILRIVYDIPVEEYDNVFVDLAEKVVKAVVETFDPGVYIVNIFTWMKYLPSWFPGGSFHKDAAATRVESYNLRQLPFEYCQKNMKTLGSGTSVLRSMIEKAEEIVGPNNTTLAADMAKESAAMAYVAGADTTLSSIQAFFAALANHPDVQKKAQAELDAVVGRNRLPNFGDMQDLPYINAVVKEIFRWHNVLPFSVARRLMQDDEYEGYFIPRGTTVFMNVRAILRDPDIYPDPDTFNPSRWLIGTPNGYKINEAIPDPEIAVFGAGRRICPGRYLAHNALFILASNVLACFDIHPLDPSGKPAKSVSESTTDGIIVYPLPFKVSTVPRSRRAVELISETVA